MKKHLIAIIILSSTVTVSHAQLLVSKLLGKNSNQYTAGWGAFLNVSIPVSEADAVTTEFGVNMFFYKANTDYGIATAPLKIGYLYTFDRTGSGFYIEPQLGYNLVGLVPNFDNTYIHDAETKFNGVATGVKAGYLIDWRQLGGQINLGLREESVFYGGGSVNSVGFSISYRRKRFHD